MEYQRSTRDGQGWLIPLVGVAMATGMYTAACSDTAGPTATRTEAAVAATPVVFDRERIRTAEAAINRQIELGSFPGAALAVGVRGQQVHLSAMGRTGWTNGADFVDASRTLYDLASLTKAVATTTAVMLLVEDGTMRLDDRVSKWVPEFAGGRETGVTIRQLLTHTAGVRSGASDINP
ncbi:MAG TPA: serine hydrolase domain-containing protein, partial [Longimicrobium sp.]|nr:serine hydrolase domain-containing protein [Longimicrobium sp.]